MTESHGTFADFAQEAERDLSAAGHWSAQAASAVYNDVREAMPVPEQYKGLAVTAAAIAVGALAARPLVERALAGTGEAALAKAEDITIVPLTRENLPKAIAAGKDGFSYGWPVLNPARDFRASLDPVIQAERAALASTNKTVEMNAKYWLAVDKNGSVVGTTGLYETGADKGEAAWMGWMSVPKSYRGQGIGKKLVDFSIEQARADGKGMLRLYTSTYQGEAAAQGLYEREGLKVVAREPHPIPRAVQRLFGQKEPMEILVRELKL